MAVEVHRQPLLVNSLVLELQEVGQEVLAVHRMFLLWEIPLEALAVHRTKQVHRRLSPKPAKVEAVGGRLRPSELEEDQQVVVVLVLVPLSEQ